MKNAIFVSIVLFACARDSRPATSPAPPPEPARTSNVEVPNLDLNMQQVDGLPISELVDPGAKTKQPVKEAIAMLHPTRGNQVSGSVRFIDREGQGVEVIASVDNLPSGKHAYHVHVFGDCSAPDATSAGPHFHFTGSSFDEEVDMITGNLGELQPQQGPTTTHRARIEMASLQGEFSIIGRAVVVHAKGNDPDVTPDGGAGDRLACGVIGVANARAPQSAQK